MRILFYSKTGDGSWLVAVLAKSGHSVDWTLKDDKYADTLAGIIPPPSETTDHPEKYDMAIFDDSDHGDIADGVREHTPTIGSSKFADTIEHDRLAGIELMEECGINVPDY